MPKIYAGSTQIKKIYAGSTQIKKVYVGSTLVYQAQEYMFNGGTVSGYSWGTGYGTNAHMSASGNRIYSDSDNKVGGVAEGTLRCKFNASNFSYIKVNIVTNSVSKVYDSDNAACYVFIGTSAQSQQNLLVSPTFTKGGKQTGTGVISLDVRSLTGDYYVVIGGAMSSGNSFNIKVSQVWGE